MKKKKIVKILFTASLALSLFGCTNNEDEVAIDNSKSEIKVERTSENEIIIERKEQDNLKEEESEYAEFYDINVGVYLESEVKNVTAKFKPVELYRGNDIPGFISSKNNNVNLNGDEFVALRYSMTLPSSVEVGGNIGKVNLTTKIVGINKETKKYNGYTYIGVNAAEAKYNSKAAQDGEVREGYILFMLPKGYTESDYVLEIGEYNTKKTYISLE